MSDKNQIAGIVAEELGNSLGLVHKTEQLTKNPITEFPKSTWRMQKNAETSTIQLKRTKNYLVIQIAEIESELAKRDDA